MFVIVAYNIGNFCYRVERKERARIKTVKFTGRSSNEKVSLFKSCTFSYSRSLVLLLCRFLTLQGAWGPWWQQQMCCVDLHMYSLFLMHHACTLVPLSVTKHLSTLYTTQGILSKGLVYFLSESFFLWHMQTIEIQITQQNKSLTRAFAVYWDI